MLPLVQHQRQTFFLTTMNLNHRIDKLSFGELSSIESKYNGRRSFGGFASSLFGGHNIIKMYKNMYKLERDEIEPYNNYTLQLDGKNDFEYYVKILPVSFELREIKTDINCYSFSMNNL